MRISAPFKIATTLAIIFQLVLLGWQSYVDGPWWDEVGHFSAGLSHWYTGSFQLYQVNPPLVRMIGCAPIAFSHSTIDLGTLLDRAAISERIEFVCGKYVFADLGPEAFWLLTIARWTCIPFSLLGLWICHRWANELYGQSAGLFAATLWAFSPSVLAYGHLIVPDMGATAFGLAANYCFWKWLGSSTWKRTVGLGVMLGLTWLCKTTWLNLLVLWPVLWIGWRGMGRLKLNDRPRFCAGHFVGSALRTVLSRFKKTVRSADPTRIAHSQLVNEVPTRAASPCHGREGGPEKPSFWREGSRLAVTFLIACWVVNLGCGFEGSFKPLGDFNFLSQSLGGTNAFEREGQTVENRFTGTFLGHIPVPVPENYLQGIDFIKMEYERKYWSFFRGEVKFGRWWNFYLFAMLVKEPEGTWVLGMLAVGVSIAARKVYGRVPLRNTMVLLTPAVAIIVLVSSQTGFSHSLRYVLPAFPFLFIWISKLAGSFTLQGWGNRIIAGLTGSALCWSTISSLMVVPHSLMYFNQMSGGPKGGYKLLGSSCTDWGQD